LNFTYNFDLLKNVLSTIIKNQNNLKKEYDEKFQAQSEEIELLKQELEKINEENGPKGRLRVSKNDFNELKGKVNDFEDKLTQINEALDQSKLKYY
jgi:chromosome segregation ATPase